VYKPELMWYGSLMNEHTNDCRPNCKDHHFTGTQQAEYDSLNWRGRDFYDDARWNEGASHDVAFRDARYSYGLKKSL